MNGPQLRIDYVPSPLGYRGAVYWRRYAHREVVAECCVTWRSATSALRDASQLRDAMETQEVRL